METFRINNYVITVKPTAYVVKHYKTSASRVSAICNPVFVRIPHKWTLGNKGSCTFSITDLNLFFAMSNKCNIAGLRILRLDILLNPLVTVFINYFVFSKTRWKMCCNFSKFWEYLGFSFPFCYSITPPVWILAVFTFHPGIFCSFLQSLQMIVGIIFVPLKPFSFTTQNHLPAPYVTIFNSWSGAIK